MMVRTSGMAFIICGMAALAASAVAVRPAWACKFLSPRPHTLDAALVGVDAVPPQWESAPTVGPLDRGDGRSACSGTSCDDQGTVPIMVAARDDRAPAQSVGYRVRLVSGKTPTGFVVPAEDVRPYFGNHDLSMRWHDGASDDQESFHFTLSLTPVDLAGNLGETRTVVVSDPGSGGCAVAGSAAGSAWPLVVVVLVGRSAWRRRRTRLSRRSPGSEIDRR